MRIDLPAPVSPVRTLKPSPNSESWWFEVNEGDVIMFPSSLTHMVQTVDGEERISIAFNTFLKGTVGDTNDLTELML